MASPFHSSQIWQRTSAAYRAENPWCVMCREEGRTTVAAVTDHIIPVAERPDLRLDWDNLQSLCKRHHDGAKARQENTGRVDGCTADGLPLDPEHPWQA